MADANANNFTNLRDSGPWTMVDSVRIGRGMGFISRGWFENWAAAARPQYWNFFLGRDNTAIGPWCNRTTERNDYAMKIYRIGIEFHVPPVFREFAAEPSDVQVWPVKWASEFAANIQIRAKIQGTDELLWVPAVAMPAGVGPAFQVADVAAGGMFTSGTNGQCYWANQYTLPEPIEVPAGKQFILEALIDGTMKDLMAGYPTTPGVQVFPGPNPAPGEPPTTVEEPLIYSMRCYASGQRFLQLRGAMSAG